MAQMQARDLQHAAYFEQFGFSERDKVRIKELALRASEAGWQEVESPIDDLDAPYWVTAVAKGARCYFSGVLLGSYAGSAVLAWPKQAR